MHNDLRRRAFLRGAAWLTAAPSIASLLPQASPAAEASEPLDSFITNFMQEMNAPGLTLATVTRTGSAHTASFGFADLESKARLTPDHLFEIGSITKSFVALTLLQLRQEGKVDFQKPVLDYLPWLPIRTDFGTVTTHHLLTHTSGLPDALSLFVSDPAAVHVQGFKPGENFYYCNAGFAILGYLIAKLDARPWTASIQERIMKPLGMSASHTSIGDATRAQEPSSYVPFFQDRVYLRHGRLAKLGPFAFEDSAGSIASTPGDMAKYLQMLLNHGEAPSGRIVTKESFELFSKPYILAPEFSSTAHYGYGISVDRLDGHTILRHTGGMASFMSAMHVDLDAGVAAFASINAQLGYRPNLVTQYAVQTMRAQQEAKALPKPPEIPDPLTVKNASEFAGVYTAADGHQLEVTASGDHLSMKAGGATFALEAAGESAFHATDERFQRFPFVFGRAGTTPQPSPAPPNQPSAKPPQSPIVELSYGGDWYTNDQYKGPKGFSHPAEFESFAGHYTVDSPWAGSVKIVLRKGQLWLEGTTPLAPLGGRLFRFGLAETVEFHHLCEGKTQLVKISGQDLWRVEAS